jgi:hypothetical protein
MTPATASTPPTELDIFRRIVDDDETTLSTDAARALLRLKFGAQDRQRMNQLAEKNRLGRLTATEEQELESFMRAGQLLGILQSKARQALKTTRSPSAGAT